MADNNQNKPYDFQKLAKEAMGEHTCIANNRRTSLSLRIHMATSVAKHAGEVRNASERMGICPACASDLITDGLLDILAMNELETLTALEGFDEKKYAAILEDAQTRLAAAFNKALQDRTDWHKFTGGKF